MERVSRSWWQYPIAQITVLLGGALLIFLLVLGLSGGSAGGGVSIPASPTPAPTQSPPQFPTPTPLPATVDRNDPALVHSRVIAGLQNDDPAAIFNELLPAERNALNYAALVESAQEATRSAGPIQEVRMIAPPLVLEDEPWNGMWAEAEVELLRGGNAHRYRAVYVLIEDAWWLFGTIPLTQTIVQP